MVSRFQSGDRSNDPPGTSGRTNNLPAQRGATTADDGGAAGRQDGGDLQGLQERLGYLKDLGINTLYLTSIFHSSGNQRGDKYVDLMHIDDSLGVKGSLAKLTAKRPDTDKRKFSGSDRVFLTFLKQAHEQGFRVVLEAAFGRVQPTLGEGESVENHLLEITRRWMDPNKDDDPSDGVDGWVLSEPRRMPHLFWKRWRTYAKKINPKALLIGDIQGDAGAWLNGDQFDTAINRDLSKAIRRFFGQGGEAYTLKEFFVDLTAISRRYSRDIQLAAPVPLSGPGMGRILNALSFTHTVDAGGATSPTPVGDLGAGRRRWRIATVIQYLLIGAPMVYYGDEVGMYDTKGGSSRAAMWWGDVSGGENRRGSYRGDFASLINWLNIQRELRTPLRSGSFRTVLADEKRGILAFARSLPASEMILLINYGDAKEKVLLPAGKPGQLVGVLGPRLYETGGKRPPKTPPGSIRQPLVKPLGVGGSRRFVNPEGRVRLWLNPMSVRLVLVTNKPPH